MFDSWDSWNDDKAGKFLFDTFKLRGQISEQSKRIDKIEQEVNKMEKRNIAPKEIQGQYKLNIKDNKIVLTDNEGNEYISRCHPDDKFKVGLGVEEAFTKKILKEKEKIKVGDIVRVKDSDECYPLYTEWMIENLKGKPNYLEYLAYFNYNHKTEKDEEYKVIYIAPHKYIKNCTLCLIQVNKYNFYSCYLIDIDGLEKVNK